YVVKKQCRGGLTLDVCGCCKICAKLEGEVCDGMWGLLGDCDQGLFCKHHFDRNHGGRCVLKIRTTRGTKPTEVDEKYPKISTEASGSGDLQMTDSEEDLEEIITTSTTQQTSTEASGSGDLETTELEKDLEEIITTSITQQISTEPNLQQIPTQVLCNTRFVQTTEPEDLEKSATTFSPTQQISTESSGENGSGVIIENIAA
uniref:hypothetical protein n=1 Tax=Salmonella sp. s54925 TaxID=3159674 RepID=UPI003980FBB8